MASNIDTLLQKALVEKGYIASNTIDPVVMKAAQASGGLASFLVQRGIVKEEDILNVLSDRLNLEKIDLPRTQIQKAAIDKVPLKVAEYYKFVPVKLENRKLTVAVSYPYDTRTLDTIRTHLGCQIEMVLAREQDVSDVAKKWYGLGAGTIERILEAGPQGETAETQSAEAAEKVEDIEKLAEDASVINLVNQILLDAFQKRATDIHVEPYRGKVKVRYRIDGVLYNTNVPPEIKKFIMPIVSRIKIMSNLNIIEKRLPQDGRAIVKVTGETLDLRISSIPTPSGESIVIRLLPMQRLFSLEKLGLDKSDLDIFSKLISKPHGIVYITGPTGSGKSTTLYACLSSINNDERKIITIEDPVEYEMEGVTQIQVLPSIGLDFAKGLKSILRHDPDVIMVGEVRDLETAEIAARVALTGHLVFSTLHTNDAASGITRLVDIGVEPYLVASSVEAFLAQRLVRLICSHCKEEDKSQPDAVKEQIARELGLPSKKDVTIYKGKGCDKCNSSGFWGRIAIFEILPVDETIRQMIMRRVPAGEVKKTAVSKGMRTIRKSGWIKVLAGQTTPEEIIEVSPDEDKSAGEHFLPKAEEDFGFESESEAEEESREGKKKKPGAERRAFKRIDAKLNIWHSRHYKSHSELRKADDGPEQFSVTKNVSAGGLVFISADSMTIGSIVEIKIELPGEKAPIECIARVVRVDQKDEESAYDVAVCFLDLSSADRGKLDQYVNEEGKA
ncbi:MAG: Flp pilus assembly complex ATPase component TadA [Candidatus Omnitrophica bacterium]|nr:Flp pilus assembly complex ATPase component TadA [Candidatus Omnitrophota bacterium]